MRQADSKFAAITVDEIFEQGLHEFLLDFMASNVAISEAIASRLPVSGMKGAL
jgi:hypothetical protein